MRTLFSATAAFGAMLTLSACATTGERASTYSEELAQLAADCSAQNGILTPTGMGPSDRPALDYACRRSTGLARSN